MSHYKGRIGAVPVRNKKGDITMEKVIVERYKAGVKPEFASDSDISDDETSFVGDDSVMEEVVIDDKEIINDRRLQRLNRKKDQNQPTKGPFSSSSSTRKRYEPEVLVLAEEKEDKEEIMEEVTVTQEKDIIKVELEDEKEEEVIKKRALLREKLRQRELEEIPLDKWKEESSEYEEYSESDVEELLVKPVFVNKHERKTISTKEDEEKNNELQKEKEREKIVKKKDDALKLVAKAAQRELEIEENEEDELNKDEISDGDGEEQEEYEKWKGRELARIKRDKEERDAIMAVKRETEERRKTMTVSDIMKEKLLKKQKIKGTMKYLQKYYHRGAYFVQDDDKVYNRDFTVPTGEDLFDKTVLPKVMQVKNFGRSGRTKWTHLTAEDTTSFDSPWTQQNGITNRMKAKMGGLKQDFNPPTSRKTK